MLCILREDPPLTLSSINLSVDIFQWKWGYNSLLLLVLESLKSHTTLLYHLNNCNYCFHCFVAGFFIFPFWLAKFCWLIQISITIWPFMNWYQLIVFWSCSSNESFSMGFPLLLHHMSKAATMIVAKSPQGAMLSKI